MLFIGHIQVGLIHHQAHAQQPLIEIDRRFAIGANHGDVVDALSLDKSHMITSKDSPEGVKQFALRRKG
jgi:uncharacterized protein YcbX